MFRQKFSGFTLLEILIALFIFTIVSLILVNALHSILTTQASTEKHAARLSELQMAMTLLSRDLEQTINRPITTVSGGVDPPLMGTEKDVTFTHAGLVNPLGELRRSTLQRTRYRLGKGVLFRESWEALDQTPYTQLNTRAILSNVAKISYQYLDQNGNFQVRWPPTTQTSTEPLPHAVKITIELIDLGSITQLYLVPEQKFDKLN